MNAANFPKSTHSRIVKLLAKGFNQEDIAKQVGVTRYYVSKINCGWSPPYPKARPTKKAAKKGTGTRKTAKKRTAANRRK